MDFIILIVLIFFFINAFRNISHYSIEKKLKLEKYPFVSILVPVRNEEQHIKKCLYSLINQDYPEYEIIVLDDRSEDNSLEIIKSVANETDKIKIIEGSPLPDGWTGKNFACYQLAKKAKGEWFLFTDADTIHNNDSLKIMISEALRRRVNFLTVLPYKQTGSLIGQIFLPIVNFFFGVLFPASLLSNKIKFFSFALGPFILIHKSIYWKIEGHKGVKNQIVEDVELARLVKSNGGRIACVNAVNYVTVFYYNNFQQLWHGFSKNFFGAIGNSCFIMIFLIIFASLFFLYPSIHFIYNFFFSQPLSMINIYQVLVTTLIWLILVIFYKEPLFILVFHPLCIFLAIMILINSFRLSITKKVVLWKDRTYEV